MKFVQYMVFIVLFLYGILELDGIRQVMYDTYTKQYLTEGCKK